MPRTALIVAVPEAEPVLGHLRLAHDWSAPLGVPAHVTILFPFAPNDVDEGAIAEVVSTHAPFAFALDRLEHLDDGLVWLRPTPAEPFAALTEAVWRRFPQYPPYGGAHEVLVPHLTVSYVPVEVDLDLPIHATARVLTLIEEAADGRWSVRREFPFQGVA
jgi:hypothetical protein